MSFDELCADFNSRRKNLIPSAKELLFQAKANEMGDGSLNDLLRRYLRDANIAYLNTFNGDVWFFADGEWNRGEFEVAGGIVSVYARKFVDLSI